MLPARSHVTSDGRLKLSPLIPAPGAPRPPPRPPPSPPAAPPGRRGASGRHAAAGGHAGSRPHANVLRLAAEHELEPAVAVELHHLVRAGVDDPDVVLRIDAHLLREIDRVDALADLLDELAVLIELKQA